ncbi:MAG TPA: neutral zinc metallopeptidase, partial [Myxococcales bacterium]
MRLGDDDRSNVEDRRGIITGGRLGLGGILVLGVLSLVFRQNFFALLGGDTGQATQAQGPQVEQRKQAEQGLEKVAVGAFNDAQSVWGRDLRGYRNAKLVLFWDRTDSGCGGAGAAMGPFYCPEDERVYIDLGFYRELSRRFGAPGDFAQAYVI